MTSRAGAWAHAVARVALVGGVGAALVVGAQDLGTISSGLPPATGEQAGSSTTTAYCPGAPFAPGAGSVVGIAAPAVALEGLAEASGVPGAVTVDPLPAGPSTDDGRQDRARDSVSLPDRPVRVRGSQDRAPGVVAGQSFTAEGEERSGLATLTCTPPEAESWLIAGEDEDGSRGRLVLVNPASSAATAEVSALGGRSTRVRVPAEARTEVPLDRLRGEGPAHVVHVRAEGGPVSASLAVERQGELPAGVATVGPTTAPATRQVVPGNADAVGKSLVLAAPGERDAKVEITAAATKSSDVTKEVTVPAGEQREVDLPEVEGMHTWLVDSDEPVLAAGRLTTATPDGRGDRAWTVATPPVTGLAGASLPTEAPKHVSRYLEVAAPDGPARVEILVLTDGRVGTRTLRIDRHRSKALDVGRAEAVWVRPRDGRVHAAVLLLGDEKAKDPAIASMPLLHAPVSRSESEVVRSE
ncbi:DUF5719 family protein [Janibacter corallicola]|uniref:DUF5719 family protein n=1 Tax=Janibacter corallicola TaxID=415212 RepID=UPI00082A325D|nr:DUF5719 family protein [Janibacter corallicola]